MRALALTLLSSLAALAADPSLEELAARLRSDAATERDAAEAAMLERGEEALPRIRELMEAEKTDVEAKARLERVVGELERRKAWGETWKVDAMAMAKGMVEEQECFCGNKKPWKVEEIEHEAMGRHFKDLRFFLFQWMCCQDKPHPWLVIAVGPKADERAQVGVGDWAELVKAHWVAATTADEAAEGADAILSLLHARHAFQKGYEFNSLARATEADGGGWWCFGGGYCVKIGAKGELESVGADRRR